MPRGFSIYYKDGELRFDDDYAMFCHEFEEVAYEDVDQRLRRLNG